MTLSFFITVIPDHDKPQPPGCLLESAGAAISRTSRPLESVIYHEQQIRDEQERQAQELARRWHEEQEPEARIWRGPSMGM
ncbi:mobilization protein [Escherichia coli]|uniref:mobilization protein n=1 Tax=Escherichia coli TaxID=562 RepID=UPI00214A8C71